MASVSDLISPMSSPDASILVRHLVVGGVLAPTSILIICLRRRIARGNPRVLIDILSVLLGCLAISDITTTLWVLFASPGSTSLLNPLEAVAGVFMSSLIFVFAILYARAERRNNELSREVSEGNERLLLAKVDRERVSREAASTIGVVSSKVKRLASVVDASPHPIIGINADGTVWQWGPAAEELLNLSADQVVGARADAHPGSPLELLWREVQRLENHPECGSQSEVEFSVDNGQPRIVWMSLSRLPNHGEGLGGWSVNLIDITEKKRVEQRISAALREKEALLKEVHHRVKNNLQLICSLLRLQSKEVSDLPSLSMFRKSEERIRSLALVHEKLYRSESLSEIPFGDYLGELSEQLVRATSRESGVVRLEKEIDAITLPIDVAISAGLIANELLSYSLKHVRSGGTESDVVKVSLKRSDGSFRLTISDNSRDAEASNMVSEPTTLSFKLAKSLSVQLKGHLFWESDNGARFILSIPERIIDPASVSEKRAAA